MTLFQIIQILKQIALTQPNIKSATDGSIYEVMNTNPSVKYDVVHFSQTTHQSDEETDYYGLNIFYVSRLEDSLEDNRLQIQSIGKEVLDNIIRTFCENWGIDFPVITYTPFTQKFNDLCAGCYCNLRLEIPKEIICADDFVAEVVPGSGIKLQDIGITITQNGLIVITPDAEYDGIGEIRIQTEVPQAAAVLQDKEVEYTENGSYSIHPDPAYDGLSSVSVDVLVPDNYDKGYDDGKTDGENEQKAKLVSTAVTQNGTYSREDGYSSIEVNVPQTGQTINNQSISRDILAGHLVYAAGHYMGFQTITHIPYYTGIEKVDLYIDINASAAIEQGENQQKAKMVETAFTQNGTYTREDGYSAITVNVDDRYDEGYEDGYRAGAAACSGLLATAITLNVASAITDSGTATTTYSPSTAYTDIYYTSSDTSKATIDENTGEITVIENGTVTICTRDRMSGLQDCKSVKVTKSPSPATSIAINVASTITDAATATTTVTPSTAVTNLTYSSSDTSKATINATTGAISVKASGSVQFCVLDSISNKQSCKTVNVRKSATAITLNVPTTVTDSATATTTVSPTGATTNLTYTSSDTSIATVSNSGVITAKADGTVTICVKDSISGLQSCKTITVRKSATALKYTADTSTVDVSGEIRTITYDATGFNDDSFGISISGATGATYTKSGNVFAITFPKNPTTSERDYVVTLTATTYGGSTKSATLTYTQEGLPEVGGTITAIYNVTSTSQPIPIIGAARNYLQESISHLASITIDGVTYPVLDVSETGTVSGFSYSWFSSQDYYGNLCYKFSSTGRKTVTFNIKKDSSLITGGSDNYGDIWFRRTTTEATPLVAITFGEGITYIKDNILGTCTNLTAVSLSNTVQKLGVQCFAQCTELMELNIPSSVTYIGSRILLYTGGNWSNNRTITIASSTPCEISPTAFDCENNTTPVCNHTIKVPSGTANTYKTATNWSYYANKIS